MKKLFGLALLALASLAPDLAQAASRFAVCTTTCTWDNTSTAMWSASSGGATGASAPTSSDTVTIDAATCVGGTTCTITTFSGTISVQAITWGACTASTTGCIIDASANNTNFTISGGSVTGFSGTGTGTRKWLAGTGTYAITNSSANGCFSMATTTNDQGSTFSGATWSCSGATTSQRTWAGGGFSFGPTTWNANSSGGTTFLTGANTWSSLTVNGPLYVIQSGTQTVTNALTLSGTSSTAAVAWMATAADTPQTISLGAASTAAWLTIRAVTTSGAAALTGTNCIDLGRNTFANGGSCSGPTGGSGGGRIIGG